MAATAVKRRLFAAAVLLSFAGPLLADRASDVRSQISYVATSLASGSAADALTPFDKSCSNYQKISDYFQGLTVYQIENEVDVTDEDDFRRAVDLFAERRGGRMDGLFKKAGVIAGAPLDAMPWATVERILADIAARGDTAVRELSARLDRWDRDDFPLTDAEIDEHVDGAVAAFLHGYGEAA